MTPDFKEILRPLDIAVTYTPLHKPDYIDGGRRRPYITYQSLGQDDVLYGDDRELDTVTAYVINVYSEGPELGPLMERAKALLEAAGWIVKVDPEIWEEDVKLHRYPMYARKVGAWYG